MAAVQNPAQGRADGAARLRVEIRGAVQGVGFRPFVYRLAAELGLSGWVINDTRGVFIEAEGGPGVLQRFLERLPAEKPPLAVIQELQSAWLPPAGYAGFTIGHSDAGGDKSVVLLPDAATCADCLREIRDPRDRRYRYPFTNCTNCGPRLSIIEGLPYDRPNTTMRRFTMCPQCQAEYDSPADRRFHAQPNACPLCGPRLAFYGVGERPRGAHPSSGAVSSGEPAGGPAQDAREVADPIRAAAAALATGLVVAVKGLGGFHLMVDAANTEAIARLRGRKPRRDKPFAVMVRDVAQARALCHVPPEAEAALQSPQAPIVLLRGRGDAGADAGRLRVSDLVAPGNPYLGVMLPYTPLHHLLLAEVGRPVVATSGNLTDEPICTANDEAFERLGGVADCFLVHDRPIARHVDDSVAWVTAAGRDRAPVLRLLRRARGYAPLPVLLPEADQRAPTILAVGAHLKNTVALSVGRQVFISQHIGDLETPEALAAFERVIADFLAMYEVRPAIICHDLHPDYLSTRWAREQAGGGDDERRRAKGDGRRTNDEEASAAQGPTDGFDGWETGRAGRAPRLVGVQHHHAHLAACLADNGVSGPALGVIWDGTGYGADGTVWGGEFLLGDAGGYRRVAHLRPFRLPGGEAAVREPRRCALALLWELMGDAALELGDLAPLRSFSPRESRLLVRMLARAVNAPVTSSAGRLFDGIAALAGLGQEVTFEAQAAMALEFAAGAGHEQAGAYEMPLVATAGGAEPAVIDWAPLVRGVLADLRRGATASTISARFHNAAVAAMVAVAEWAGQSRVALSGGCFQNRLLAEQAARKLAAAGFEVLLHRQAPPNDGGISLGQAAVAAAQTAGGDPGHKLHESRRSR